MIFLVGLELSLFVSSGITAQLPTKSLFWLSKIHVHGNSPGLESACEPPLAPASTCLEPQVLLVTLTFSEHPWVHGTWLALLGLIQMMPKTDRSMLAS